MYSLLLRKALPFALTFVIGSLVGGLFKAAGFGGRSYDHPRAFYYDYGEGHSCRMRYQRRYLVAKSKPLQITFKPDAVFKGVKGGTVPVSVTFGADGTVRMVGLSTFYSDHDARPPERAMRDAAVNAAWQIQFQPETVDGVPVTVTRDVEIRFMAD